MNDGEISGRVETIIQETTANLPVTVTLEKIFLTLAEGATADPNELIGMKVGACRYCWGDAHGYQWKQREYLEAMDKWERDVRKSPDAPMPDVAGGFGYMFKRGANATCPECEGMGERKTFACDTTKLTPGARLLYGGVKQKKDSDELIIADRVRLWDMLIRMRGGYTENVKVGGQIGAVVAAVQAAGKDPQEAAKAYMAMVQSVAIK